MQLKTNGQKGHNLTALAQYTIFGITLGSLLQRTDELLKDAKFLSTVLTLIPKTIAHTSTDLGASAYALAYQCSLITLWQQMKERPKELNQDIEYNTYYQSYRETVSEFKQQAKAKKYDKKTFNFKSGKFCNTRMKE